MAEFSEDGRRIVILDERCPDDIVLDLIGLADQCGKRQYWNAISRLISLPRKFTYRFDCCLKKRPMPDEEGGTQYPRMTL